MKHMKNRGEFISLRFPGFPIGGSSFGKNEAHIEGR
jgi:hypothetical protein